MFDITLDPEKCTTKHNVDVQLAFDNGTHTHNQTGEHNGERKKLKQDVYYTTYRKV